jgi:1,2-diacylglycerol-3-alpha-glucose alpha-1,2-galactosyltransferase
MTVNIVSESIFAKEQGVHTAFLTTIRIAKQRKLQVLVNSLHRADVTHIHTVWPFGFFKLKTSHPTVVTAHIVPESLLGSLKGDKLWYAFSTWYLPRFYNAADLVLAVSPLVKQQLLQLGVTTRIEIFPNPVDTEAFHPDETLRSKGRQLLDIPKQAFVVMGSGQVQPRKGISDFITIAKAFPAYTFVWVGNKPFKAITAGDREMDALLANPPENFFLKGPFQYETMGSLYNAADVFLFPSFQENAPMSIIEAAACGLPLVLRDNPEYKLLYETDYLGCADLSAFKKTITHLHTSKKDYDQARKASLRLGEKYAIDTLGDSLIRYYESVL